jgi:hypothetical protein
MWEMQHHAVPISTSSHTKSKKIELPVHRARKFSVVLETTLAKNCKTKDKSESAHATHALQEHKTYS